MKNTLILILIIFSAGALKAQSGSAEKRKNLFSLKADKTERPFNIKKICKTFSKKGKESSSFHFLSMKLRPKVSVDLLDGSGIHLFTISDVGTLPALNVGARFRAGIVITI